MGFLKDFVNAAKKDVLGDKGLDDLKSKAKGFVQGLEEKTSKKYKEKYPAYADRDFSYDCNRYPSGTEMVNLYTKQLRKMVDDAKRKGFFPYDIDFLVRTFLEGTVGKESADCLYHIYSKNPIRTSNIGEWFLACDPIEFAGVNNEKECVMRQVISSENFRKWSESDVSWGDFIVLYNGVINVLKENDSDYINWEKAVIWSPEACKKYKGKSDNFASVILMDKEDYYQNHTPRPVNLNK